MTQTKKTISDKQMVTKSLRNTIVRLLVIINASVLYSMCGSDAADTPEKTDTETGEGDAGGTETGQGDAGGTAGDDTASFSCGAGAGTYRGKSSQTLTVDGIERTFVLYVPENLDSSKPVPLVVIPHYYTGSGERMFYITGYDEIADREGFVAAFPDGRDGTWNVGEDVCGLDSGTTLPTQSDDNDQAFLAGIIEFVNADQCVDEDHVYITGLSMGGYFTHETACSNPAFRAAGPHSAGTHDLSDCMDAPKPIIIFHFRSDTAISYDCALDARDKWAAHNGCSVTSPDTTTVEGGICEYYKGCPADGQVALCTFEQPDVETSEVYSGHGWSGGAEDDFAIPPTQSASELGWAFFRQYAW